MKLRKPAYYTVQELCSAEGRAIYHVRGYDAAGNLLRHTWHRSVRSMQIERMDWEAHGAIRRPFSVGAK